MGAGRQSSPWGWSGRSPGVRPGGGYGFYGAPGGDDTADDTGTGQPAAPSWRPSGWGAAFGESPGAGSRAYLNPRWRAAPEGYSTYLDEPLEGYESGELGAGKWYGDYFVPESSELWGYTSDEGFEPGYDFWSSSEARQKELGDLGGIYSEDPWAFDQSRYQARAREYYGDLLPEDVRREYRAGPEGAGEGYWHGDGDFYVPWGSDLSGMVDRGELGGDVDYEAYVDALNKGLYQGLGMPDYHYRIDPETGQIGTYGYGSSASEGYSEWGAADGGWGMPDEFTAPDPDSVQMMMIQDWYNPVTKETWSAPNPGYRPGDDSDWVMGSPQEWGSEYWDPETHLAESGLDAGEFTSPELFGTSDEQLKRIEELGGYHSPYEDSGLDWDALGEKYAGRWGDSQPSPQPYPQPYPSYGSPWMGYGGQYGSPWSGYGMGYGMGAMPGMGWGPPSYQSWSPGSPFTSTMNYGAMYPWTNPSYYGVPGPTNGGDTGGGTTNGDDAADGGTTTNGDGATNGNGATNGGSPPPDDEASPNGGSKGGGSKGGGYTAPGGGGPWWLYNAQGGQIPYQAGGFLPFGGMFGSGGGWSGSGFSGAGSRGYGSPLVPHTGYSPGFMPEWNYFPYSNPPAASLPSSGGWGLGDPNWLADQARDYGFTYDDPNQRWNAPDWWTTEFDPNAYEGWGDLLSGYMPDMSGYVTSEFDPTAYEGWGDVLSGYMPDMSGYALNTDVFDPSTIASYLPDMSGYLTAGDLPAGFDPSGYDWSDIFSTYQRGAPDLSGYLTAGDLPAGFDPTAYDWSNVFSEYQRGAPDLSGYLTAGDLPAGFDPTAYEGWGDVLSGYMPDMSGYLTAADLPSTPDLSGYVTGTPWADQGYLTAADLPSAPDLSGYVTGTPWADQGYLTADDMSGYVTGDPWADQGYLTAADLPSYDRFDPSTYNWGDIFSQYQQDLPTYQQPDMSGYVRSSDVSSMIADALAGMGYPASGGVAADAGITGGVKPDTGDNWVYAPNGNVGKKNPVTGQMQWFSSEAEAKASGYQEGGIVSQQGMGQGAGPQGDPAAIKPVAEAAALAIAGQHPNPDEAIAAFIAMFGQEAFVQFREQILQALAGNQGAVTEGLVGAQPQGMQPQAPMPMAAGGMADNIPGTVAGQQDIAVSPGEFIVPSDVVSGIGDGDTNSGAQRLYSMMDRVRENRTGTQKQPAPINVAGVMPR